MVRTRKGKRSTALFWLDSGLKNRPWQCVCFACLAQQWMTERVVTVSDSASFTVALAWQWKQMSQSNQRIQWILNCMTLYAVVWRKQPRIILILF